MADNSTQNPANIPPLQTMQYVTPTTGSTVTATAARNVMLLINPAGTLVALTLALNGSPLDGDIINLASSQVVTGFTMSGGTVIGPLTSLAVATFATYCYSASSSNWFRVG